MASQPTRRIGSLGAALAVTLVCALASTSAFAQPAPPADVEPPVVVGHVDAVYPPTALKDREHADVVLALTVDVDGHVSKVDVLESAAPDLDEAAIVAARQWTFVPAKRHGKPVASRIRVPFHFAPPAPPPEMVTPPPPAETTLAPQPAVQQAPAPPTPTSTPSPTPTPTATSTSTPTSTPTPPEEV